MTPGTVNKKMLIGAGIAFSRKAWDTFVTKARDTTSEVSIQLVAIGVRFEHAGRGRSPCFVKP
jgi:hypothetical protein